MRKCYLFLINIILSGCAFNPEPLNFVYTGDLSNINEYSAQIEGTIVTFNGEVEEYGHCWIERNRATDPKPEEAILDPLRVTKLKTGVQYGEKYTSMLKGLFPGTDYIVWGYIKAKGKPTSFGKAVLFKTDGLQKPKVTINYVSRVESKKAVAFSRINQYLGGEVIERGHCWRLEDGITPGEPDLDNANSKDEITQNASDIESSLNNLTPEFQYRVRAYVKVKLLNNQEVVIYSNNSIIFTTKP